MLRDSQPTLVFRSRRIPAVADYARHEPEKTLLHEVIRAELEPFMVRTRTAVAPVARFVEREIRAYLDCGVPVEEDQAAVEGRAKIPPRCVRWGGMSLHADVAVPARDRRRLERLCRYVARPPLALGRIEAMADGRLAYRLKTPWRDGTTHVVMERRELLERLAPLIPPPRAHQVRYHGVLAPCASAQDQVVPAGPNASGADLAETARPESNEPSTGCIELAEQDAPGAVPASPSSYDSSADRSDSFARRIAWADWLKRVFEIDALRCPGCGGRMRLMAAITDASIAGRILESLALPPRAPPLEPANQDASRSIVEGDASFELPGTQDYDDAGLELDQTPDDDRLSNEGA